MNGRQIREITAQGLTYLADTGEAVFIDFSQCLANYKAHLFSAENLDRMQELNHWTNEHREEFVRKQDARMRLVADRNILTPPWADGPYIEFYTEPRTRFKFDTEEQFREVRTAIEEHGWRTYDLS